MMNPFADNFIEGSAFKSSNDEFNPLTPYNYGENAALIPLSAILKIKVAEDDKILSLEEHILSSNLSIKLENGVLSLIGKNEEIIGSVNIPLDQFLKSVSFDSATNELVFVFVTTEHPDGEEVRIDVSNLIDTYTAGSGLSLNNNEFSINEKIVATKTDIKTINDNLVESIDTINKNMADGFNTINGGIENEIKPEIAKKVEWSEVTSTPGRKSIILKNHDILLGTDTTGSTHALAMVSKWDVADFGAAGLHSNLNSKDRPTVQLPGQSGEEAEEIAFLSDIPSMGDYATKIELSEVNSKFGSRFDSGATVSETIIAIENNLNSEVEQRTQADEAIATNLQNVSNRVTALETSTDPEVINQLRSDIEKEISDRTNADALIQTDIKTLKDNNRISIERITNNETPSVAGDYVRITDNITNEKIADVASAHEVFMLNSHMVYADLSWLSDLGVENVYLNGGDEVPVSGLTEANGPYLLVQMKDLTATTIGNPSTTIINMYAFELKPILSQYFVAKSDYDALEARVVALETK